nr:MAG TPA: repressor protein [Caudoviricetes sp.]
MELRETVKELCRKRGISLNQLEIEIGVAKGYLSKLGKSKPSSKNLQKISDYFGVSLDYLMTGKEPGMEKYSDDMADLFVEISRSNDVNRIKRLLSYYMDLNEREKDSVDSIVESLSNKDNTKKNG